jgi:FMN phosphatase YigB (HAD superfamily)
MQKVILFDWGRTLYDPETKDLFPGVTTLLGTLSLRYALAIVCLATDGDYERRRRVMRESGIEPLFRGIYMADEGKDELYERALKELGYRAEDAVVVDDRAVRGIRWGAQRGAQTVWVCRGKFAEERPTAETGYPTHTIQDITELSQILGMLP